jgi:hypothetical protein
MNVLFPLQIHFLEQEVSKTDQNLSVIDKMLYTQILMT